MFRKCLPKALTGRLSLFRFLFFGTTTGVSFGCFFLHESGFGPFFFFFFFIVTLSSSCSAFMCLTWTTSGSSEPSCMCVRLFWTASREVADGGAKWMAFPFSDRTGQHFLLANWFMTEKSWVATIWWSLFSLQVRLSKHLPAEIAFFSCPHDLSGNCFTMASAPRNAGPVDRSD